MRVIDCDRCAETITAANDLELARAVREHFATDHDETLDDEELKELLVEEAYDAMDS